MASDGGLRFLLLPSDFTTADLNGWLAFAEERDEVRVLTRLPVVWDETARLVLDQSVRYGGRRRLIGPDSPSRYRH